MGITYGRGSFADHLVDHLPSGDHLQSGITCGTVQISLSNTGYTLYNIIFVRVSPKLA